MDRRFPVEEFQATKFSQFFGKETERLCSTLLTGGACNSNYLVETPKGEKFVCRIHKRGNPRVEKKISQDLQGIIPVPVYLWEAEGFSVIEYIEGDHFKPSEELVRDAGRIIGRLQRVSFENSGEFTSTGQIKGFEGWESYKNGLISLLHSEATMLYLSKEAISCLENLIHKHTAILSFFDSCHSLVHGDFRPDNILISGERIVGIIDWEFSHSGCSYMDIGNLLRHLPSHWDRYLAVGLEEEGFNLPDDWRFRALLIDLTSHLEFITSKRSDTFKKKCAQRIHQLIKQDGRLSA